MRKTKEETKRIKGPHMRCLRSVSGATSQNKVPNEKTKGSTVSANMPQDVKKY
jgi:hypothetical protein